MRLVFLRGLFQLAARLQNTAWLTYLGRESFWVYLLHQPFCCGFVGLVLYSKLGLPIPAACAAAIVLGLTLPCCAVWLGRWAHSGFGRRIKKPGGYGTVRFSLTFFSNAAGQAGCPA